MSLKVASYSIIHYGKDYAPYALRSVSSLVDQSFVFYTPHPSHGHNNNILPIETREEIMSSIPADEWGKIVWIDTDSFWNEGPQRDYAVATLLKENVDIIINLDYDEIHNPQNLEAMIREVWDRNISRNWLVNMYHFWRSFGLVCEDDGWPVRIIDTRHRTGTSYISPNDFGKIYHFGYAVTDATMKYKWTCHGHFNELRPNWFEDYWNVWPPPDNVHPTNDRKENGEGWWNPKPFDKNLLPEVMKDHPWYHLDFIS